ncbi:MAG: hypothetical protein SOX31_11755 [Eubacteriales bacterium]|nr:hypothetical protein [Eubacteriales bacterium]
MKIASSGTPVRAAICRRAPSATFCSMPTRSNDSISAVCPSPSRSAMQEAVSGSSMPSARRSL